MSPLRHLIDGRAAGEQVEADTVEALANYVGEHLLTEIYMRILSHRGSTLENLRQAGYSETVVKAVTTVLEVRGLILPAGYQRWEPAPPDHALTALAASYEGRARNIRAATAGLVAAYRAAEPSHPNETSNLGIEYISGAQDVAFAMAQCYREAERSAKAMRTGSLLTRKMLAAIVPESARRSRGLESRALSSSTVIQESLVHSLNQDEYHELHDFRSEHILLAPHVPFTAVTNDTGTCVVEGQLGSESVGLRITNPLMTKSIEAAIDVLLELATPWNPANPASAADGIDAQESEILQMLAAGLPDAAMARRLDISTRTLDRRIRSLSGRLGATTRFQAGAKAAERGWV